MKATTPKTIRILVLGGWSKITRGGFFIYESCFVAKSQINPDSVKVCTDSVTPGFIVEIPMWLAKKINVAGMDPCHLFSILGINLLAYVSLSHTTSGNNFFLFMKVGTL